MLVSLIRSLSPMRLRAAWLPALIAALVLAACAGGSGSSGFDILAENAAIDEALASDDCTMNAGLTICPSGVEMPSSLPSPTVTPFGPGSTATASDTATPTPTRPPAVTTASSTPTLSTATPTRTGTRIRTETPTATPILAPAVETNIGSRTAVPCARTAPEGPCVFVFTFQPIDLPVSATYAVAYRTRNPDGEWHLVATSGFMATIPLEPGAAYQFAVLVFPGTPGQLDQSVEALAITEASYAFVTPVLVAGS